MTVLFCFAEAGTFWGAQPGLRFGLMIRPQSRKCWGADVGCRVELSSFFLRHDGVTEVGVLESRRLGKVSLTGDLWACGKFGHCGGLNRYGPQSLICGCCFGSSDMYVLFVIFLEVRFVKGYGGP